LAARFSANEASPSEASPVRAWRHASAPGGHTVAFSRPAGRNRPGGLDTLRQDQDRIDRLVGRAGWKGETLWFEKGGEEQIEVIRWIKGKLEAPGTTSAYLVDPFLGSEALQRVCFSRHDIVPLPPRRFVGWIVV
jgi:hypothetical protein